jgi:hypothetical protein
MTFRALLVLALILAATGCQSGPPPERTWGQNRDLLQSSLMAGALILSAVVGLTVAAKSQSPGSAFQRAVLVTTSLGTALGFVAAHLFYSACPMGLGMFPGLNWLVYPLWAFFMGGAALAVGLLGGGLIAWLKNIRSRGEGDKRTE